MSKKENQQFTTKAEIHHWLKKMGIKTYTIDDNLVVDVDGTVNLYDQKLSFLPFQFGKVSKNFKASVNEVTSLKGTPNEVGGYLDLSFNKITSLEYFLSKIINHF